MITYFSEIDKYLPKGTQTNDLDQMFENSNVAFVPLDFDTEYNPNNQCHLSKPEPRILVSTQVACNSQNPLIYSSQSRHAPHHPVSDLLAYNGFDSSQIAFKSKPHEKYLTLVVASHFQTVELAYFFNGNMRDIWINKYLANDGYITSTKRVMVNPQQLKRNPAKGLIINELTLSTQRFEFGLAILLVDTAGLQGAASYKDLMMNSGLDTSDKDLNDLCKMEKLGNWNATPEELSKVILPYKPIENMERTIVDFPQSFDKYAVNDLKVWTILDKNNTQMLDIKETLDIPRNWSKVTPLTSGAAVANLLELWLARKSGLNYELNSKTQKNKNHTVLDKLLTTSPKKIFTESIGTDALLVKTFGGRCVNNRPTVMNVKGVLADADEDGCYGNGQKHQDFPLGKADILAYPLKDNVVYKTLGEWLKDYQDELVPGLWHAIIDTQGDTLKYKQDFFASWIANQSGADHQIYKRLKSKLHEVLNSDDVTYTEADFSNDGSCKIVLNEIRCGVITHDGLQWILKTCSQPQRAELLNKCKVVASAVFLKSKECQDYADFKRKVLQYEGKIRYHKLSRGSALIDETPRYWFRVPLKHLMHPLSRERKKYPKKDKNLGGKRHPMNDRNKLVINTAYGDFASSYFPVSNPVVGNNITARARAMGWYMEKATQAFGIITDGSVFDLNNVVLANPNRPLTASNCIDGVDTKSHKLGSIGGEIWAFSHTENGVNYFYRGSKLMTQEEVQKWLDNGGLADHIRSHFPDIDCVSYKWIDKGYKAENYQIIEEFDLPCEGYFAWEMKGIYREISYHGTSNYLLTDFNGKEKCKMRSYNEKTHWNTSGEVVLDPPSRQFLRSFNSNHIAVPDIFFKEEIIKLGEFQTYSKKFLDAGSTVGDTKIRTVFIKPLSLSQFKFQTVKQLNFWKKQKDTVAGKLGWYLEGNFYDSETRTINYKAMIECVAQMISEGVKDPMKHLGLTVESLTPRPNFKTYLEFKERVSVVNPQVKLICPSCGSDQVIKKSTLPSGATRHQCKSCKKTFSKKCT